MGVNDNYPVNLNNSCTYVTTEYALLQDQDHYAFIFPQVLNEISSSSSSVLPKGVDDQVVPLLPVSRLL